MATTLSYLQQAVTDLKGCKIAHIETLTDVDIPKKWGINGVVTKRAEGQVQLNYSYGNAVNNRREKEGMDRSFEPEPLRWGEWLVPNKIITHKGKLYLRYYLIPGQYLDDEYFVDGRPATDDELKIINEWKASKKQSSRQEQENKVKLANVTFENIVSLKCGEINYEMAQRIAL
jgi:hypothetical protein